jgi:hypothetical protein
MITKIEEVEQHIAALQEVLNVYELMKVALATSEQQKAYVSVNTIWMLQVDCRSVYTPALVSDEDGMVGTVNNLVRIYVKK